MTIELGDTFFLADPPPTAPPAIALVPSTLPPKIGGMAWFAPLDQIKPPFKASLEQLPGLALTPATLPPKISGMAFEQVLEPQPRLPRPIDDPVQVLRFISPPAVGLTGIPFKQNLEPQPKLQRPIDDPVNVLIPSTLPPKVAGMAFQQVLEPQPRLPRPVDTPVNVLTPATLPPQIAGMAWQQVIEPAPKLQRPVDAPVQVMYLPPVYGAYWVGRHGDVVFLPDAPLDIAPQVAAPPRVGISGIAFAVTPDGVTASKPAPTDRAPGYGAPVMQTGFSVGCNGDVVFLRDPPIDSPAMLGWPQPFVSWAFSVGDTLFLPDAPRDLPAAFGQAIGGLVSTIAGMAWFEPWDAALRPLRRSLFDVAATLPISPLASPTMAWQTVVDGSLARRLGADWPLVLPFPPLTPVSGMAWSITPDAVRLPILGPFDRAPALGTLPALPPVPTIYWHDRDSDLVISRRPQPDGAVALGWPKPFVSWSFSVGDTVFLPDAPIDRAPAFGRAAPAGISGIAWFNPADPRVIASRLLRDVTAAAHAVSPIAQAAISATPMAFMPWSEVRLLKASLAADMPVLLGALQPPFTGVAWLTPADAGKVVRSVQDQAATYLASPAGAPFAGLPLIAPGDTAPMMLRLTPSAPSWITLPKPVGVAGIAWLELFDEHYRSRYIIDSGPMPEFYGLQRSYVRIKASSLYARTIEVHRSRTNAGSTSSVVGLTAYSGMQQVGGAAAGEDLLFTGIPASIQAKQTGRKKDSSLPGDAVFAPTWHIYVPLNALPKGGVRDRDIIVDDEFYRYEVAQAYWNLLGWKIICIRLEA